MSGSPSQNYVIGEEPLRFRTIFISDIHLGTRDCKADFLLDFLRYTESDYLYLIGDIIDGWHLKRSWTWKQAHNDVIQKLLRKARKGTRVIYVPGNHDENFRDFAGHKFGRVSVRFDSVHRAADGRRFLIIHGDQFDGVVRHAKWLALLGDRAYQTALMTNRWVNLIRRKLGLRYWSLSAFLKHKVKNAVEFICHFEDAVVAEAKRRDLDGVICGHIHVPQMKEVDGLLYCNDGDWVESCTALVEHYDGRLELINWADLRDFSMLEAKPAAETAERPLSEGTDQPAELVRRSTTSDGSEACESSSFQTPGILRSMVSFARLTRLRES